MLHNLNLSKNGGRSPRRRASVLLIALAFILLMTAISVAFLLRSRVALRTSDSYAKEVVAQELGKLGADKLAADFQKEIAAARAEPAARHLFLPPRVGVADLNPRSSPYVRRTMGDTGAYNAAYASAGFAIPPHANPASAISTATPSRDGRAISEEQWRMPGILRASTPFEIPEWVYVDRQISPPASVATEDVIGRYAAAVYDVGGLLDVNEAGTPLATKGDKGSTVFADLPGLFTDLGLAASDADTLNAWRASPATLDSYYGPSTFPDVADPTKAGRLESPLATLAAGENFFFSRMELVQAANKNQLGLSPALLPYLRVGSRTANRVTLEDVYANGTNVLTSLTDAALAATADRVIPVTRINGITETFTVKAGDSLLCARFPLARLRWLASRQPDGTPDHPVQIKRYFGLTWDAALRGFIYTSPDDTAARPGIRTLANLCTAINAGTIPPREPDFFEWLKGAINPDSLGKSGGSTNRLFSGFPKGTVSVPWESSKDLHILRIGANIIDQSDADSIPTPVRSEFTDVDPSPFDSFGVENIPYLNEVVAGVLRSGNNLNAYLQFEMWNPNRNPASLENPPRDFQGTAMTNFRVRVIKGRVLMEPLVYVQATAGSHNYKIKTDGQDPPTRLSGTERHNPTWACLKRIVEYSQRNLTAASFHCPDLADAAVNFSLNAPGGFFAEPYLANGDLPNGQDSGGPVTPMFGRYNLQALLGDTPGTANALLACAVTAPNPAISGILLDDIYTDSNGDPMGTTPALVPQNYTASPLGAKAFNAARIISDGSNAWGVTSAPVTFAVEVRDGGGAWHTCQIYNNLAISIRQPPTRGRQQVILSADADTASQNRWTLDSNTTTACFGAWTDWTARRGFHNTDPRTERFGLSDSTYASPGMSSRTHPNTTAVFDNGLKWNVDCGVANSVGTSFTFTGTISNEPAAAGWGLLGTSPTISVPADLALNIDPGGSLANGIVWDPYATQYHCYSDGDNVVRPADARWVNETTAHPMLPVAAHPGAIDARPGFLNRPFRSVAELGTVFRDVPWKSLDFFSPASADQRLLDIFSLADGATVPGQINPNLASLATLNAVLRDTSLEPANVATVPVGDSDAGNVAAMISSLNPNTVAQRITSLENLAGRISSGASSSPKSGNAIRSYKPRTENYLRALSSTSDTRSWQILFDVIAQSGRIAQGSDDLANFIVSGQRRFLVCLTLDRISGEVVDKKIEPVYE